MMPCDGAKAWLTRVVAGCRMQHSIASNTRHYSQAEPGNSFSTRHAAGSCEKPSDFEVDDNSSGEEHIAANWEEHICCIANDKVQRTVEENIRCIASDQVGSPQSCRFPPSCCPRRSSRRSISNGAVLLLLASISGMISTVQGGQVVDVDGGPVLPFMMNMTNPFHPSKSLSFAHVLFLGFSLTYADTAGLRGYIGQDVTQLGRYYAKTKFGCITHCDSSDFNGIDGILGLGMPDAALASIPEPLFFALSDETGDPANQYILNRRIFTIVSTDSAAELHLGGFDPHATAHDMKYMRTTSPAEYAVPVSSITLGGHEFLNFASAAQAAGRTSIPGILDSGTSCLVVPDSTLNGLFLESPYTRMMEHLKRDEPLYITIGDHQFEIPFHHWWLYPNQRPCIQSGPEGFEGILLGDVVFRALVVMFDLTHPRKPVIGLAPRNPDYRLVVEGCSHVNDFKGCVEENDAGPGIGPMTSMKMSVRKRHFKGRGSPYLRDALKQINGVQKRALQEAQDQGFGFPDLSPSGGDKLLTKVPVDFYEQTQYFVNVSVYARFCLKLY